MGICETFEGAPSGLRRFDDDGDGVTDEDALDGADNDGDGQVDEDFAGVSQQMFRSVTYDTSTFLNQFIADPLGRHTPMGLRVEQESYAWTDPLFDDFVGIEYKITNISRVIDPTGLGWDINRAYVGFMVDGDVGVRASPAAGLLERRSGWVRLARGHGHHHGERQLGHAQLSLSATSTTRTAARPPKTTFPATSG